MTRNIIIIIIAGERTTHMRHTSGNYATLCGLDGDDSEHDVDQRTVVSVPEELINCSDCKGIFEVCREYKPWDFVAERKP